MRVVLSTIFLLIALVGANAQQDPIRLSCNVSKTETVYSGQFSAGQISGWKSQNSSSFVEIVDIDLTANTWSNPEEAHASGHLAAVTNQEFVLLNYDLTNHFNNWRINRVTGLYSHESRNYDPAKNETTVSKTSGTCHKISGVQQF